MLFVTMSMDGVDGGVPLTLAPIGAIQETPQDAMDGVARLLAERVAEFEAIQPTIRICRGPVTTVYGNGGKEKA